MAFSKLQGTRLGIFRAYFFGFFVCTAGFLFGNGRTHQQVHERSWLTADTRL